jgi:integrating conjugative element protein (TIGR03757 family)
MTAVRAAYALSVGLTAILAPFHTYAGEVVEVFRLSNQPEPAGAVGATVYVVDAMHQYMAQLSVGLSRTPAEAAKVAKARVDALTPEQKNALRFASTARIRAAEYGITKTPAIVFDGRAVLYGITDVEQARLRYRNWLANGGAS